MQVVCEATQAGEVQVHKEVMAFTLTHLAKKFAFASI